MKLTRYQRTFAIRFSGYFFTLWGVVAVMFQFGPIVQAEVNFRKDELLNIHHTIETNSKGPQTFGSIKASSTDNIKPVSTDFGIVIEKIDANAKVIANVDPADEDAYIKALAAGVAEAKGSTDPGEPGNLYIFSHSTDAPWNVARYNAIFYLLRELNSGDKVIIFYKGVRYDYVVFDKTIVSPKDLTFLINRYDKPVLTMQTCDPPGTSLNRLIVRAKLAGS
jgi:LPXTG-site transpeptidase (sortase) family protein